MSDIRLPSVQQFIDEINNSRRSSSSQPLAASGYAYPHPPSTPHSIHNNQDQYPPPFPSKKAIRGQFRPTFTPLTLHGSLSLRRPNPMSIGSLLTPDNIPRSNIEGVQRSLQNSHHRQQQQQTRGSRNEVGPGAGYSVYPTMRYTPRLEPAFNGSSLQIFHLVPPATYRVDKKFSAATEFALSSPEDFQYLFVLVALEENLQSFNRGLIAATNPSSTPLSHTPISSTPLLPLEPALDEAGRWYGRGNGASRQFSGTPPRCEDPSLTQSLTWDIKGNPAYRGRYMRS